MSWRSRRETARLRPELIGALVILGVIALFYLAATKELPLSAGYEARLTFASANQIAPNAPVRIAGVDVGDVKSVEQGPSETATVVVELDDEALPIHTDATAKVRPRTFLEGSFFVDIHPGSPSAPELPDGGTIPVGQTSDPVQLDQILSTLQPGVRESLRSAVRGLGTAFSGPAPRAINRTIPQLESTFENIAVVSEAVTGTEPHDLSRAIESSSRVVAALAHDRPRLGALVSDFSTVARALSDRQAELRATIGGLDQVLGEAPPTLEAIDAATPKARSLVAATRPFLRRAPGVINPAVPLTRELRRLLAPSRLPALVSLARPTVSSLAGAAPDTITSFAGLRAPTGCLLDSALPTLTSAVDDGDLSTGQPVYRELLYSLTGLASATRNFDGNGFSTRYYAGFGTELQATTLGDPGAQLLGLADQSIAGSRPIKPSVAPPLRPDVACEQSETPDLSAAPGPGGFAPASGQVEFSSPTPAAAASPLAEKLGGAGK
jgi:phospholipid/cholesterol/gamma-HCH transport system substrate-binding protein